MDKENLETSNIIEMKTPPALIPAGVRKSSVKKSVRFSEDNVFPTFIETLAVSKPSILASPTDSVVSDPIGAALLGRTTQSRSIWDTPTSSGRPSFASPGKRSPGRKSSIDFESKMLKFAVVENNDNSLFQDKRPVVLNDDPMLLSGATSVASKRRLSTLNDMESELLNSSSPPRRMMTPTSMKTKTTPQSSTTSPLDLAGRLGNMSLERSDKSCWEEIALKGSVTCPAILNAVKQQFSSVDLTLDSAVFQLEQRLEQFGDINISKEEYLKFSKEAHLAIKKIQLSVFENMVENVCPTINVFNHLAEEWLGRGNAGISLGDELGAILSELDEEKTKVELEFESKFHVTESGEIERRKNFQEVKLESVDRAIAAAEKEIQNCVDEILIDENKLETEKNRFENDFKKLRSFYFQFGWHIVIDNDEMILIYSVGWLFLFQKNENIRLEKLIPVKGQKIFFEENFLVAEILAATGLEFGNSFQLHPQSLCDIMNAATSKLAQWTLFGQTLVEIVEINTSWVTINSLNQIEVGLVVLKDELPILVRLVWFDSIGTRILFDNFSFILSDFVQTLFPNLKKSIEIGISEISGPTDQIEFFQNVINTITKCVNQI